MPTQSQPTALPTPFQTALKLADEISRLDLESITKERVQMTILIQRAIEQREAALVAENKRLRSLAIMCNAYLEPIADQLELCHKQPTEAKALRQLLEQARALLAETEGGGL